MDALQKLVQNVVFNEDKDNKEIQSALKQASHKKHKDAIQRSSRLSRRLASKHNFGW